MYCIWTNVCIPVWYFIELNTSIGTPNGFDIKCCYFHWGRLHHIGVTHPLCPSIGNERTMFCIIYLYVLISMAHKLSLWPSQLDQRWHWGNISDYPCKLFANKIHWFSTDRSWYSNGLKNKSVDFQNSIYLFSWSKNMYTTQGPMYTQLFEITMFEQYCIHLYTIKSIIIAMPCFNRVICYSDSRNIYLHFDKIVISRQYLMA